ncbi:hypothetical protein, partial [Mycobacterium intracellulare]|uniref:hypothetical protein n=1 Tax=Mycobacterium intracellulare TaxID=1767 RepID=UPI001CDA4F3B
RAHLMPIMMFRRSCFTAANSAGSSNLRHKIQLGEWRWGANDGPADRQQYQRHVVAQLSFGD